MKSEKNCTKVITILNFCPISDVILIQIVKILAIICMSFIKIPTCNFKSFINFNYLVKILLFSFYLCKTKSHEVGEFCLRLTSH